MTPAPSLVADLVRQRFSGTLRVERQGVVKVLYFNQGDLACASSSAEDDRLGNLLVRHGRLSAEQLAHAKEKQPEKATIGNILVELGFITSAELLWGARRQVEEILNDLAGWREGTYLLRDVALAKEVVNLGMPGRSLLIRALQQLSDRDLVLERVGTLEAVLLRQPCFDEVVRGLDFGFPADDVLAAIDGQRTVHEICEASGLDDFQACKVLYTLMVLGAVDHELRPARELIFVEGELQNGEEIPRVDDGTKTRRSWLRPARASTPPAQPAAPSASTGTPPPARQDPEAASAETHTPEAAAEPETGAEETPAPGPTATHPPRPAARRRRIGRTALWAAALAVLLLAIGASLYYATYLRPTLDSDDAEEARLVAALMEELEEGDESDAPEEGSQAAVVPGIPDTGGGSLPGSEAPPADKGSSEARPTPADPKHDFETDSRETPTGPQAPLAQPPRRETPALENRAPLTMLSRDGNFREALNLVRRRRLPEAAESFQRALTAQSAGTHTVQLLLACQGSTVEKAFKRTPDRTLYFVTTTFRGETCYRLFDGLYASAAEARENLSRVPAIFLEDGNRPTVVRVPRR